MVSIVKETNETLLNLVNSLKNRAEESRLLVKNIQEKMDEKLDEAKQYKNQVDDAKTNIKALEEEISSLHADLQELKEKYGKKNLVAVIEAGTKEINIQIKQRQEKIAQYKNKIAELTNRARSIKDLLLNLKNDKKIKELKLQELEESVHYYGERLEEVIKYTEEHENLNDFFAVPESVFNNDTMLESGTVFEDIANIEEPVEEDEDEDDSESGNIFEPVTDEEADEVFDQVMEDTEEEDKNTEENVEEIAEEPAEENVEEPAEENVEEPEEIIPLDSEPLNEEKKENEEKAEENLINEIEPENNDSETAKVDNINQAIDTEFTNIFGTNINEPFKINEAPNIFDQNNIDSKETDIVNALTNLGLDYYSFKEEDRKRILDNYNEQTFSGIVNCLKENNIPLENIYEAANILTDIAPAELSNIITKLLSIEQSNVAIGFVLDKLPEVDINLLNEAIKNYGEYINNVDLTDIILKSLKGGK